MYPLAHLGLGLALALALERSLAGRVRLDPRFVLLGAMLPDLIDKPLSGTGLVGGRAIAHTAVFALALAVAASAASRRTWAVGGLAFGVATHLVLDGMWAMPDVLLWPAYGLAFPPDGVSLASLWETLLTDRVVQAGEVVGGLVLGAFAVRHRLYARASFARFWRRGMVAPDRGNRGSSD